MDDDQHSALDLRIELEKALAPVLDLSRETNVLLRAVLEDLRTLTATVEAGRNGA